MKKVEIQYPEDLRFRLREQRATLPTGRGQRVKPRRSQPGLEVSCLAVTPGSTRVRIGDSDGKRAKGSFAVGGLGGSKAATGNYMGIMPASYFIGLKAGMSNSSGATISLPAPRQVGLHAPVKARNVFTGFRSGWAYLDSSGADDNKGGNTYLGCGAGRNNQTGARSTFIGHDAGHNETGSHEQ